MKSLCTMSEFIMVHIDKCYIEAEILHHAVEVELVELKEYEILRYREHEINFHEAKIHI